MTDQLLQISHICMCAVDLLQTSFTCVYVGTVQPPYRHVLLFITVVPVILN